jgi:hypothetical protein
LSISSHRFNLVKRLIGRKLLTPPVHVGQTGHATLAFDWTAHLTPHACHSDADMPSFCSLEAGSWREYIGFDLFSGEGIMSAMLFDCLRSPEQ